jgi:SAM-dependent methyltransferase
MRAAEAPGGRWAEIAYEAMAPVYDAFTAHHEYDLWLAELLAQLERHGLKEGRLLDVGCGTGKSFLPMLARGWQVTACDISPAMLELARAKAGDSAELAVADMRELPRFGEFELVWALDDAVNYLLSTEELETALAGMGRNLAPGGLLLFDLNTLRTYRTFFAESSVVERDGVRLAWTGRAKPDVPPGSVCEARFELVQADDDRRVEPHLHRQRHFPEAEVRAGLRSAGLELLDVFGLEQDGILKQPLDEAVHTKVVYIARAAPTS